MTRPTPTEVLDRDELAAPVAFHLPRPVLHEHHADGSVIPWAHSENDLYELLTQYGEAGAATPDLVGFVVRSTGWAAPIDEDGTVKGAPSRHAKRRRVALSIAATPDGVVSRISFEDDPTEAVDDCGAATGSLADAVHTVAVEVFGRDFLRYLTERAEYLGTLTDERGE